MAEQRWRVGVDVGGTFTDVALLEQHSGRFEVLKVPTTPDQPSEGVIRGLEVAEQRVPGFRIADVHDFLHGTTITTNALIQRTFRPCALLVTDGLTGSVFVQDQRRVGSIYDLRAGHPPNLVAEDQVYEVRGRIGADGTIVEPLDRDSVLKIARRLESSHVETVAVCLLFSFANPAHEEQVGEILSKAHPGLRISLSSEVLPRIREWPRISTMLLGCSLEPLLVDYVDALARGLVERGISHRRLFLMESNGGLMPFSAVTDGGRAVHTLLSGPAAGVQGAIRIASGLGRDQLLTMDVGGTSADIAFVQGGRALEVTEGDLVGHQIYVPMLDLATVGAGGGTLCRGSHHGRLLVGPQSAGADPGPACYGKGGKDATVTDANLVRGLLDPSYYLGGQMQLDVEAAEQALETTLAAPLNLEIPVAATAAARLNEVHMADAIKVLAAQRGVDLSATTLVACGGAGPLHACAVADELGVRSVLVPQFPGAFSAVGLLGSDVMQDFVQTLITSLLPPNEAAIFRQFGLLEARARESLTRQGFHPADIDVRREVDARYAGQGFELRLPAPYDDELAKTLRDAFHAEHERIYGHAAHEEPVEIVSYRVRAVVTMPTPDFEASSIGPDHAETDEPQYRRIFHVDEWIRAQVVRRSQLSGTSRLVGPVVVEQPDTTTLVPPGWALEVDAMGNLVLSQEAAE